MSSEGKPMLTDPSALSDGDVCLVDEITYLGIEEKTEKNGDKVLTYFTSPKPQRIPQGIQAKPHCLEDKLLGLRLFKVYREGADTYDIVYVGTMSVVDGIPLIVGEPILDEEPDLIDDSDDSSIILPPFAVTYPVKKPAPEDKSRALYEIKIQKRRRLEASMKEAGYDTSGYGFELEPSQSCYEKKRHNIYPDRCPQCNYLVARYMDVPDENGKLSRVEDRLCDNCGIWVPDPNYDDTLVRKVEAQRRCEGKGKGETDKMDIDCGGSSDSAAEGLSLASGSCASVSGEGQTVSKDVLV